MCPGVQSIPRRCARCYPKDMSHRTRLAWSAAALGTLVNFGCVDTSIDSRSLDPTAKGVAGGASGGAADGDAPGGEAGMSANGGGGAGAGGAGGGTEATNPPDGGWSWFEEPRAIFHAGKLVVGSVASGHADPSRTGDVEVFVHDLGSSQTTRVELHDHLERDDHDSSALLARPDGRLLALYAKHGSESRFFYRVSEPDDPTTWGPEQTFVPTAATRLTYSNPCLLAAEQNRVYDFYRGLDNSYKPSYAFSDDLGDTWQSGNIVIDVPTTTRHRPYVRYASNSIDTIHLVYTEAHPRDFDNSLYHIFYRDGALHGSDGTALHALGAGLPSPDEGTRIYQGGPANVAWIVDVEIDAQKRPVTVYSVQMDSQGLPVGQGGDDIRYRYARWDGTAWQDHPLAYAGSRLYSREDDYSGLAALDPEDPSLVYISTNADPVTGAPLLSTSDDQRHYELFLGKTSDGGASWQWHPITQNSTADNLRPLMPPRAATGERALIWLRGSYTSYTNYQQQVVALIW